MKGKSKKVLSGATAILCAVAVLISGTLAWQAVSSATNPFSGVFTPPEIPDPDLTGANLHDDFPGMSGQDKKTGVVNKDVYVENTGDKDVFVRIKLSESLDGDTPVLFIPKITNSETGEMAPAGNYADFVWSWSAGASSAKPYNTITGTDEWAALTGNAGTKSQLVGDADGGAQGATADTSKASSGGTTLDKGGVITMAQYKELPDTDKAAFVGWIYDADGYAYWSKPLAPETATGLLLDSVKAPLPGTQDYDYEIIVDMEYVDMIDIGAWLLEGNDGKRNFTTDTDGRMIATSETGTKGGLIKGGLNAGTDLDKNVTVEASNDAKELLRNAAEMNLKATPAVVNMSVNEKNRELPAITNKDDKPVAIVKWESSDPMIAKVDVSGKLEAFNEKGSVTITGYGEDGSKVEFTVTVTDALVADGQKANGGDEIPFADIKKDGVPVDVDNWTTDSPLVTVEDGKLVISAPADDNDVTVTLTGRDDEGQGYTFDIVVSRKLTAEPVSIASNEKVSPEVKDVNGKVVTSSITWNMPADQSKVTVDGNQIKGVAKTSTPVAVTGTDSNGNVVTVQVTVTSDAVNPSEFKVDGPDKAFAGDPVGEFKLLDKDDASIPTGTITAIKWDVAVKGGQTGVTLDAGTKFADDTKGILTVPATQGAGTLTVTATYTVGETEYTKSKDIVIETKKLEMKEDATDKDYEGTTTAHQIDGSMHVELWRGGNVGDDFEIDNYENGRWHDKYPMSNIFENPAGITVAEIVGYRVQGMGAFEGDTGLMGEIKVEDGLLKPAISPVWSDEFRAAWLATLNIGLEKTGLTMELDIRFTDGALISDVYTVKMDFLNSNIAFNW